MKYLRSIAIAFSLYSRIPMPSFGWDDENYRHAISFLPLVGAVISVLSYGVMVFGMSLEIPVFVLTLLLMLVPLLITGGFHVDGFLDVQDAIHSYQPREKKLEIMKDPHIGAFAVISCGILMLLWTAALYMIVFGVRETGSRTAFMVYLAVFPLVRSVCGITSIVFRNAKTDGMLATETGKSGAVDLAVLSAFGIAAAGFMLAVQPVAGAILVLAMGLFILWYRHICDKHFGGVTGDTAGFFVVAGEASLLVVLALFCICSVRGLL